MTPLTLDVLRRRVPAAFATGAAPDVTTRYQFMSTADMITPLLDSGWLIASATQRGTSPWAEHRVSLYPRGVELATTAEVGDLRPIVHLINSHNRTRALDLRCGIMRCVCSNQLFVPAAGVATQWTGLHLIGHLHPMGLTTLLAQFVPIASQVNRMTTVVLTPDQSTLLARRCLMHVQNMPAVDFVREHEVQPLLADRPGDTAWLVFNHLQRQLIEVGQRGRGITEVRRNARLNTAFWQEAVACIDV